MKTKYICDYCWAYLESSENLPENTPCKDGAECSGTMVPFVKHKVEYAIESYINGNFNEIPPVVKEVGTIEFFKELGHNLVTNYPEQKASDLYFKIDILWKEKTFNR